MFYFFRDAPITIFLGRFRFFIEFDLLIQISFFLTTLPHTQIFIFYLFFNRTFCLDIFFNR